MLKAQATVGPTQIPKIPYSTKNTIQHVSGIAIIQYAKKVTIAPNFYWPEALKTAAATPWVVSKKTNKLKMSHAEWICSAIFSN